MVLAFAVSAGFAWSGDIVKLKSGEKFEGKLLSESATEVVLEVAVSGGSIKDARKFARKDIAEVIKATPDQIEAAELAKLVPAEDRLSDTGYQKVITERLEPFLKKYPASPHKPTVEAVLKTYREEMAKAKSGAVKLEGVWILPEELAWNTYNYEARLRRVELQKLLKAGKPEAAYRILTELENSKPASVETVTALEQFKAAIPEFERTLDRLILENPIKIKARTEANKALGPDDKKRVEQAIKDGEEDLRLKIEEDRKNKVAIPTFSEWDLKSLTDAKAALTKESQRISKIDLAGQKAAALAFQTGLKNFHEKSFLSAQRNFEDAAKVFSKDGFVKERIDVSKKAAAEAARAANEASGGRPVVATATPGAAGTPAAGTPAKSTEPAKTAGGAPVKKTPAPTPEPTDIVADAPIEEPASNLPMFLVAGAAVLLIALLVVKSLAKKKAAAADE